MQPVTFLLTAQNNATPAFQAAQQGMNGVANAANNNLAPAAKKANDELTGLERATGSVKLALGALAGVVSVAWLAQLVTHTAEATDELGKFSDFTGIAVEDLSKLKFAAEASGPGWQAVQDGIRGLLKSTREAKSGNDEMLFYFEQLGISTRDLRTLNLQDILFKMADGMAKLKDGTGKAELQLKLFKGNAEAMQDYLGGGSAGLRELGKEAEKLGLVIDREAVAKAQAFNDNLDKLKATSGKLAMSLTETLLPALNKIAEGLNAAFSSDNKVSTFIGTAVFGVDIAAAEKQLTELERLQKRLSGGEQGKLLGVTDWGPDAMLAKSYGFAGLTNFQGVATEIEQEVERVKQRLASLREAQERAASPTQPRAPASPPTGLPPAIPGSTGSAIPPIPPGLGLPPVVGVPTGQPASGGAVREVQVYDPTDTLSTRQALDRAKASDRLRSTQADFEAQRAALKRFLDGQQVSYEDYYSQVASLELQYIAEQRKNNKEEEQRQLVAQRNAKNAGEWAAAEAKLNAVRTDNALLSQRVGQVMAAAFTDEEQAVEKLKKQLELINAQVTEQTGSYEEAARVKFDAQNGELARLAKINGLSTEQLDRLRDITVAAGKYKDVVAELTKLEKQQAERERAIYGDANSGRTSRDTADERAQRSRRDAARNQLPTAQKALDAAKASGDKNAEAEAQKRVDDLRTAINTADKRLADFYDKFEERTADLISGIAKGFAGGWESGFDAVESLGKEFLKSFFQDEMNSAAREASKALRQILFDSMSSGSSGGGGGGSIWSTIGGAIVNYFSGGGARAAGGVGQGWTLVGEHGPEVVNLGQGSMVHNAARTAQMGRTAGGAERPIVVEAHYHGLNNAHDIKRSHQQQAGLLAMQLRQAARGM